jgi:hypothetical protein
MIKNVIFLSFSIMMFQVLTKKIENIYDKNFDKKKNNEIELKSIKINENKNFELNNLNIELQVANYPNFCQKKKCWNHSPKERPGFNEI